METDLRIGEVATQSGVSIDTLRYYERRKLLPTAARTASGYRLFSAETVDRVLFIKQAQELGFTLEEISTLLTPDGTSDCQSVHDLLDAKLAEIDNRMTAMVEFRVKLIHYLAKCDVELKEHPDSTECPVVDEMAQSSRADHNGSTN